MNKQDHIDLDEVDFIDLGVASEETEGLPQIAGVEGNSQLKQIGT